ncbi:pimeloyl-ACP methyl ester esterase BioH [Alteromonas facilis]|uniref:pimeloyl-ACP methyl ester esterase BioH n=1 Tax=Alteromonas facilis TaxID=2048004 RepID=UPI001F0B87CD|nr:pimeloyl-ACP methyl ester esterase BioH [Alteromonas facilis]
MKYSTQTVSHVESPLISCTHRLDSDNALPTLVLLHGWGLNSGVWQEAICDLVTDFDVVTVDLPGFGINAETLPEDYSLENIANMLAPCVPQDSILLGWSMGGLIAQHIAIENKVKLKGLISLASTPCFAERDDWHGIKRPVLAAFEKQLEFDFGKTLARFLAIQALGSPSAKSDIKAIQHSINEYPQPSHVALMDGLNLLSTVDLRDRISQIGCPTLRLYGRLDSLVPIDGVERIQALQPHSISQIFPHAAHAPFISHRSMWVTALKDFCQTL